METNELTLEEQVMVRAKQWLGEDFDQATRSKVQKLIEEGGSELTDAFYKELEFGTGGLRGIMGPGTNRVNIYTVSMATQGLCNYLLSCYPGESISVAVAHDSRIDSDLFAKVTAEVFSANGIKVYLFESLRPTPELSFTVREKSCKGGVVITASHNPKEYNGYKAYWNDGGQLISPHDKNVINEVRKIGSIAEVKRNANKELIVKVGQEIDDLYVDKLKTLSLSPEIILKQKSLGIVYTPIHGTGSKLVPETLRAFGFDNINLVEEQQEPDGNFPTVHSPNPEESAALDLALKKAAKVNADIVLGTDPDSDRVGIAVKDESGKFELLNGNQAASILVYYLVRLWKEKGKLDGKQYIAKTIVTTDLIEHIGRAEDIECINVLTGFKYIAEVINKLEGEKTFIGGGEESYGYLAGEFVRDKDAVMSCALLCEIAAWAKDRGMSMFDILMEIYTTYGYYLESLLSITRKGRDGEMEIKSMMDGFRNNAPEYINGSRVIRVLDYLSGISTDMDSKEESRIELPSSNVIQFLLEDGSKITARPSGTEPKIKFYFAVSEQLKSKENYKVTTDILLKRIEGMKKSLNLA